MIQYIDIHSHLNFKEYDGDREEVIQRMKEEGVATITIGTSLETSRSAVALSNQHENIFACVGIHPNDDEESMGTIDTKILEELIQDPKVVAVGECGMDFGRDGKMDGISPEDFDNKKEKQQKLFEEQIKLAVKYGKPLMIHARNSNAAIIKILKTYKEEAGEKLRGNAHFFTGTVEEAKQYFELGFSISFTGVITFTHDYDEVIKSTPLGSLHAETDSPFVSPVPFRGRRNDPVKVIEVVKTMAKIKEIPLEELKKALLSNAIAKFGPLW